MPVPKFSIILAAGKGTRMRSVDRHKVCFPIDGTPAINRSLDTYISSGIQHHIVVVGAMAEQVMQTVSSRLKGIIFAYQAEQLGTAHAARQGALALEALDDDSEVLIVAGDRLIEPFVLEQLFDLFYSQDCDLAYVIGSRGKLAAPGLLVTDSEGVVLGIVEASDVRQRKIFAALRQRVEEEQSLERDEILALIRQSFSDKGAAVAFGKLWQVLISEQRTPTAEEVLAWTHPEMTSFTFIGQDSQPLKLTPDEVDSSQLANYSVYLIKNSVLQYALARLNRENAQHQEYLSDIVGILTQAHGDAQPRFRVRSLEVKDPNHVMAFNNPAELLEIEEYMQSKKRLAIASDLFEGKEMRSIADWQTHFLQIQEGKHELDELLWQELLGLYGDDPGLVQERVAAYQHLLDITSQRLGPEKHVLIVRSPGRVNWMGRHVDHQGGHCNLMTIGYETLLVVHPRDDDLVQIYNLDEERFPNRGFSISDLLADLPWDDWLSLVNSPQAAHMALSAGGDWLQYVKAAVLRLQKKFSSLRLRGMDLVVHGNIPIAAGLSSSSALVVATAEAMIAINQLDIYPSQFIDLCGEGEWFVGTRGGSADHAAIKLGQPGKVVKVGFHPFSIVKRVPFLEDHVLAVSDSGIEAPKTTTAMDQFNHRVACYQIGFKLINKIFPQYVPLLNHLRDVNTRTLGVPVSSIYKILLRLPEQASIDEIRERIPMEVLEPLLATHQPPHDGLYPIRGVVLYGLAECERSRNFADLLKGRSVADIGRLMRISHDGDRVARLDNNGGVKEFWAPTSNGYLLDLIDDLESGDPIRVIQAQLERQPGSYRCSIPQIDQMVDISLATEGVIGAQLAGAGLGGCMMVLVHKDAIPALKKSLEQKYYKPNNTETSVLICEPIAGSGVLLKERS